jgi:3-phosphoshikimate 1-carboxyvinyltransferase
MREDATIFPDALEIRRLDHPPSVAVEVPGSKSITNRALILGALQSWLRPCNLTGALQCEDTEVMIRALQALGFHPEVNWPDIHFEAHGGERPVPATSANLYVANSGTSMRFLTALCALGTGRFRIDGVPRMRERPILDLLTALRQAGINAYSERNNGYPPVVVEGPESWSEPGTTIRGDMSSQFVSALLMIGPFVPLFHRDQTWMLKLEGPLVSKPYVEMTRAMMLSWNANWREADGLYIFQGCESWANFGVKRCYSIEPDASAASYFFAAATITGGRVTVLGLLKHSLQGDVAFVDVLADMGCRVERCSSGITVHGRPLHGIDVDMNAISDTVMTLAAVACFAEGPTTIRNVAHIRHKETDRLAALAAELRKVGAEVEEFADGLTITPKPLHGATIGTYNDHRMAMSMALIGLKVPGIVIENPGCVAKTYPGYFADLEKLRHN